MASMHIKFCSKTIETNGDNWLTHADEENVARLLIENGADVNVVNMDMETAFDLAIVYSIYKNVTF